MVEYLMGFLPLIAETKKLIISQRLIGMNDDHTYFKFIGEGDYLKRWIP